MVDLANNQLPSFCCQTHREQQLLASAGSMLAVKCLEEVVLPLGSQSEDAVGCLGKEQVCLLGRAAESGPDALPLTVSLKLNLVAEVYS